MLRSNCLKVIICMVLIHMRSPFYFRTQFFIILLIDQSSMEGLTHRLFSNQFMTSPLELSYWLSPNLMIEVIPVRSIHWKRGFSLMFQDASCAITVALPQSVWDHGRRHCAASCLNGVLCRVLRMAKALHGRQFPDVALVLYNRSG